MYLRRTESLRTVGHDCEGGRYAAQRAEVAHVEGQSVCCQLRTTWTQTCVGIPRPLTLGGGRARTGSAFGGEIKSRIDFNTRYKSRVL